MGDMKHILITGAGGVIGSAIASNLYKDDVQLILLDKNKRRLEKACEQIVTLEEDYPEPILIHQNLNKLDLIDQLGLTLYQNFSKLDGLICCHHILESLGPISHYDRTAWDKMLLVNLTATLRLLQSFDPLFQKSEQADLIFLSTQTLLSESKPYWGIHASIQAALEALLKTYAVEKSHTAIKVHFLDPGLMNSDFLYQAYPGTPKDKYVLSESFLSEVNSVFNQSHLLEQSA